MLKNATELQKELRNICFSNLTIFIGEIKQTTYTLNTRKEFS